MSSNVQFCSTCIFILQPKPHSWSSWSSGLTVMTEGSFEQQLAAAFAATHLESMCELDIDSEPHIQRMTHIVCTLGMYHVELPVLNATMFTYL